MPYTFGISLLQLLSSCDLLLVDHTQAGVQGGQPSGVQVCGEERGRDADGLEAWQQPAAAAAERRRRQPAGGPARQRRLGRVLAQH